MKGQNGQDFKAPKYLMLFVTLHVLMQSLIGAESHVVDCRDYRSEMRLVSGG